MTTSSIFTGAQLPAGYSIIRSQLEGHTVRTECPYSHPSSSQRPSSVWTDILEISSENAWFRYPIERALRSPHIPFGEQRVFSGAGFEATITQVDVDGAPRRVEYRFERPLEDPHYRWTCFQALELSLCRIPEVGQTMSLAGLFSREAPRVRRVRRSMVHTA